MNTSLKKLGSIFFLLLIAIPSLFSIFSIVKLAAIKLQASEDLHYEQLRTITIAENDIKWITPGKELLLNGNLFDVKFVKHKNNNLEITGLFDKEEDIFEKYLSKIFNQKQQGNTTTHTMLISLIFQMVFTEKNIYIRQEITSVLLKKNHCSFTEELVSISSDILFPPPKA